MERRAAVRGVALLLTATTVFGSVPSLMVSLKGDLGILSLLTLRGFLASAALGCLAYAMSRRTPRARREVAIEECRDEGTRETGKSKGRAFILGFLIYGPSMAAWYASFDHMDTGLAVAIAYVYPTVVVLLGSVARRRSPPAADVGLGVLALVGVAVLTLPGSGGGVTQVGVGLVLVGAVTYAVYILVAEVLSSELSVMRLAAELTAGAALGTLVVALATQSFDLPNDRASWIVVLAHTVLLVVGLGTFFGGLSILGATRASLIDSGQPLVAAVAGALILQERMLPVQMLGVGIILVSVGGAVLSLRPRETRD